MHEPRDPPLKVITSHLQRTNSSLQTCALAHKKDAFGAGRGLAGGPTVYRLPDARYRRAPRKHIRFTRDCTQAVPVAYSRRIGICNDPSAGSPTETLLRLLLPPENIAQTASRRPRQGEPRRWCRSEVFTRPSSR